MSLDQKSGSEEEKLLQLLYLMLLYISGGDEHASYLANPFPKRPNSKEWHSQETFVDLHCWIRLNFDILDQLEESGLLEQPQKGRRKQRTYIRLNKSGMRRAREILRKLNLEGAEEALAARSYHEAYINHETRIDLAEKESEFE